MKIIIIGAGNVGFETAKLLSLKQSNEVLLVARNLPDYLNDYMVKRANVHFLKGDATDKADMLKIFNSELVSSWEKIDTLFCTIATDSKLTAVDNFKIFKDTFETNYFSNIVPVKVFIKKMFEGSNIVITSASSGSHASKHLRSYSPSKWALENTSTSLRAELRSRKIKIDIVAPRTIKNKYSKVWKHDNRGDSPEDVAKLSASVISNPTNSRHYIPKRYFFLRIIERLFPFVFDRLSLDKQRTRKSFYQNQRIDTILITGSASGLGRELALSYSFNAKKIYLFDKDYEGLKKLKGYLSKITKCNFICQKVDLNNIDELSNYVENINDLDMIINCAGMKFTGEVTEMPLEKLKQNFNINFFAPVFLTVSFLKKSYKPKKIINILSTTAVRGRSRHGAYSSAKSALWSWTRALRRVYGNTIQVIEVIPSKISMTKLSQNSISVSSKKKTVMHSNNTVQGKFSFMQTNNWTARMAARYIRSKEVKGDEIVLIPLLSVKIYVIFEAIFPDFFRRFFTE